MSRAEMRVHFDVAMEVACHEALIRQTYKDSKGILTWCVGMTSATGHKVDLYIGKPAPLQHCMNLYAWALTSYAEQVREAFKAHPLTKDQFAAALPCVRHGEVALEGRFPHPRQLHQGLLSSAFGMGRSRGHLRHRLDAVG